LQQKLMKSGVLDAATALAMSERCAARIEEAWATAIAAPYPQPQDLLTDVYA